jgi:hypothetical protein
LHTLGSRELQLETEDRYTRHKFQVVSDCISIPCDAILGRDFWDLKGTKIDFENRITQMGTMKVKFDEKLGTDAREIQMYIKLPPRSESMIEIPTKNETDVTGIVAKEELIPGVYMAEALTRSVNGRCVISVTNTLDT